MTDENDSATIRLENTDYGKELLNLLWGENGSWLVEHNVFRLAAEYLDDLNPLLDTDRKVLDKGIRIDCEVVALRDLRGPSWPLCGD